MQASDPDPEALAEALARVYSRPEFADEGPRLLQVVGDLWQALIGWAADLLSSVLEPLAADSPVVRLVAIALLAALLVLLLRFLFAALPTTRRSREAAARGEEARREAARSAQEWEALAREAAAAGRFREAAVALYHAVLLRLEDGGALRLHEGKTPGDYRRELTPRPDAAAAFDRFVALFLPLAFGPRPPDESRFLELRDAARHLRPPGADA